MRRSTIIRITKTGLILLFAIIFSDTTTVHADFSEANNYMEITIDLLEKGNFKKSIISGIEAERLFRKEGMVSEQIDVLMYLSSAHQAIGHYRKSLQYIETALKLNKNTDDKRKTAFILNKLGNVFIYLNNLEKAELLLNEALVLADLVQDEDVRASILNDFGNLYILMNQYDEALLAYKESFRLSEKTDNLLLSARVLTNLARAQFIMGIGYEEVEKNLDLAYEKHRGLNNSHYKISGLINIGQLYCQLAYTSHISHRDLKLAAKAVLNQASIIAEELDDYIAASYAFGYLGQIHEDEKKYPEALHLTWKAILRAQQAYSPESLYLWQWQSGRIFAAEAKTEDAISAYRSAVNTLETIRQELLADCKTYNRVSFQYTVEPLYFELADLLLKKSDSVRDDKERQAYYKEAQSTIELLKISELQDYLQDACLVEQRMKVQKLDALSKTAGILYVVPFSDRLELLLGTNSGLKKYSVNVGKKSFISDINLFRMSLINFAHSKYLKYASKLYNYMIQPLESELESQKIDTLVFVPYGPMYKIPVAALYNGKEFLISKYAVAVIPGLNLTDPRPIKSETTKVLLAGLSESVRGFPALNNVEKELEAIQDLFKSKLMHNSDFRVPVLEKELKETHYSMLHIASHAEFFDNSRDTYILTWDDKITMDNLQELIALGYDKINSVDLLTLSACVTAEGNDRAALGLAGVAVKAGAKSALASMWYIGDDSTYLLITEFYRQLQNAQTSKAIALQQAQLKLINETKYKHPFYWAPFILIGNWL